MIVNLPLKAVLNAEKMKADRDVRYYLNGFHITGNKVQATNSHYAYEVVISGDEPEFLPESQQVESVIIATKQNIKKPIKKYGACWCSIDIGEEEAVLSVYSSRGEKLAVYLADVIDARFPDLEKIQPEREKDCGYEINVNANYMKLISSLDFGCSLRIMNINLNGLNSVVEITLKDDLDINVDHRVLLMPVRP